MRIAATLLVLAGTAAVAVLSGPSAWAAATIDKPVAQLRGLDKITARTRSIDAPVGEPVTFGTLSITVRACRVAPPEDPPENAAFLEIVDSPPGQEPRSVFSGWMFASSPGVSAMDHPVWDVWVVRCADSVGEADPYAEPEDLGPPPSDLPLPEMNIIPPPLPPERSQPG
jgi:hypothetical protein